MFNRIIVLSLGTILIYFCSAVSPDVTKAQTLFSPKVDYAVGDSPYSVAVGDFNGDTFQDLVTANHTSNTVSVLLGNGDGTFQAAADYAAGVTPYSVAVECQDIDNGKMCQHIANNVL